jgi:lysosomal Pro-X carboxypeptidase
VIPRAGETNCFNPWAGVNKETVLVGDLWDYQYCTEMFMPMAKSGVVDMYWSAPWNESAARKACIDSWGVEPRPFWGTVQWGGKDLRTLTNVVFSNGLFDPWHLGGVLHDLSETVKVSLCYAFVISSSHMQSCREVVLLKCITIAGGPALCQL